MSIRFALWLLLAAIIAASLGTAGAFAWKNLRGIKPVVEAPAQDITELLPPPELEPQKLPESRLVPQGRDTGMPLKLPDGFAISIFAEDLGKPRVLHQGPSGDLLVSVPEQGKVVALPDKDANGVADRVVTVIDGLNRPHGLASRCNPECELFIAESHRVASYSFDKTTLKARYLRKLADLPESGNHWTRTIMFAPDGTLLISVGSTCNVCQEKDWRRASILSVDPDGDTLRSFATGLRNSVFMILHPTTGKLWATEMGRDLLGDNLPPDEVNIVQEGKDYGWPYCFGKQVVDPFGGDVARCVSSVPSHIDLQAHSAPLGLAFIPEEGWPEEYWQDLFVAYHGSWNRTVPTGYKVVRFNLDAQGNLLASEDFISGWLQSDNTALGRPVDILVQPGGMMYISDDKAGVVYLVVYRESLTRPAVGSKCLKTGCSGHVCADKEVITTCEFRPEYACYRNARCERQEDGECGWVRDEQLFACLRAGAAE